MLACRLCVLYIKNCWFRVETVCSDFVPFGPVSEQGVFVQKPLVLLYNHDVTCVFTRNTVMKFSRVYDAMAVCSCLLGHGPREYAPRFVYTFLYLSCSCTPYINMPLLGTFRVLSLAAFTSIVHILARMSYDPCICKLTIFPVAPSGQMAGATLLRGALTHSLITGP